MAEACHLTGLAPAVAYFIWTGNKFLDPYIECAPLFTNHITNLNVTRHLGYPKILSNTRPHGTGRYDMGPIESLLDPSGVATGSQGRYLKESQAALYIYLWGKAMQYQVSISAWPECLSRLCWLSVQGLQWELRYPAHVQVPCRLLLFLAFTWSRILPFPFVILALTQTGKY